MISIGKFRFLALLLVAILLAQNAEAVVVDFEDMTPATYNVGNSFTTSGVVVTAEQFQWSGGTWYAGGSAHIQSSTNAGGAGYEIHTNNINLSFDFGLPCDGLSLQYGEYGGNINLEINGSLANVENFANLPATLGGTSIFVLDTGTPGQSTGAMFVIGVVGNIDSFKIGGQELWIDNVVASVIPEPATVMLLGAGALAVLTRKRPKLRKEPL
ncbi:MAG: PEP-CTERM sorting domain-containing protein [Planctomycetota bacterium]|nr:MAG: PEP-CTERM sorting domain-containing protein [Planctomycetota bacterium]